MFWNYNLPEKAGKYIVKTCSDFLGTERVLLASLHISEKGEKSWEFKNQTFKCYLDES